MPTKSGASHGFAALLSVLLGSVVSEYVSAVLPGFEEASVLAGRYLTAVTGASYDPQFAGGLALATGIAFCWGVVYHLRRASD